MRLDSLLLVGMQKLLFIFIIVLSSCSSKQIQDINCAKIELLGHYKSLTYDPKLKKAVAREASEKVVGPIGDNTNLYSGFSVAEDINISAMSLIQSSKELSLKNVNGVFTNDSKKIESFYTYPGFMIEVRVLANQVCKIKVKVNEKD